MRKKIVAGNWKMNKTYSEAKKLIEELAEYQESDSTKCEIYVAPPALYLDVAKKAFQNLKVKVFSQDISKHSLGAYTGEISAEMLQSLELTGSIVGHSERRQYHGETDDDCNKKIKLLLKNNLFPIYCNGETLEQRKSGEYFNVIKKQTQEALFNLSADEIKKVVIAYEPVWAIGTGETATPEEAQEIHAYIRNLIAEKYGQDVASEVSILYGGSVKPDNAKEIFSKPDVDGGLIGGACLNIKDFTSIIESFE